MLSDAILTFNYVTGRELLDNCQEITIDRPEETDPIKRYLKHLEGGGGGEDLSLFQYYQTFLVWKVKTVIFTHSKSRVYLKAAKYSIQEIE